MTEKPSNRLVALLRFVLLSVPEFLLAMLVAILVIFITGSVFARYVANIGIAWSDEASSLLFVWIVFVGFAVGLKHRANVNVEIVVDRLSPRWRYGAAILQDLIILGFAIAFALEAQVTMKFAFMQRYPGMQISIAWLYGAVLVSGVLMIFYALANLWETVRGRHPAVSDEVGRSATQHSE